jgi:phage recombination protein Bet
MSTELDLSHPELAPAPTTLFYGYTRTQVDLVKRTLMPRGSTDDELHLFLYTANRMGLDPFVKQIRPLRRKEWNDEAKRWEDKISIEPGIDGFRLVAVRTHELEGRLGPLWCGHDGVWVDAWLSDEPPAAAKVGVLRKGFREPLWAVALWREYRQTKKDGNTTKMWADRPAGQLAKCAEALALRAAFPHELGGVYTAEEMAQAGNHTTIVQPIEVDGGVPTEDAIRGLDSSESAKELVTRTSVSDGYRNAVKLAEVDLFGEVWEDFWRHATLTNWVEVLLAARELSEQSDPGSRTGGVGSMAPGDAGESAPHSPGSDPTSGTGASGGATPGPDPNAGTGGMAPAGPRSPAPVPGIKSPLSPNGPEVSPTEADRSRAEGAHVDGTEPGAGSRDGATSPPDGPPPPGRASGGTKGAKP